MDCESGIVCENIEQDNTSYCTDLLESSRDSFFTESKSSKDEEIFDKFITSINEYKIFFFFIIN